ncbi:MAG: tetratricopeptide repeat-containing sensor histidine kinase [Flavisolibacter sp.]
MIPAMILRPTFLKSFRVFSVFLWLILAQASVAQDKNPSEVILDSLQQVLRKRQPDSVRLSALNAFAWQQFCVARKTGADKDSVIRKYANTAIDLSKKLNNKYQEGLALYTLAALDRRDGNFPQALKKYFHILSLSEEIGDKLCAANQYGNIGDMYSIEGNVEEAIQNHLKAIKIFEEVGDKNWCISAYNRIGNIYQGAGRRDDALKYYQLAVSVSRQINSKEDEAKCYIALGGVYLSKGDYPDARKYFSSAMNFFKNDQYNFPDDCYSVYSALGWIDWGEAFFKKTPNTKESYLAALRNFQKALEFAKLTKSRWYINEAYNGLAKTYRQLQDYENALEYTVQQYQVKDSFFNRDVVDSMRKIRAQYEQEKQEIKDKAKQQVFLAQLNAIKLKMNEEKLKEEIAFSQEHNLRERQLSDQKMEQARSMAETRVKYEKSIALEKARRQKLKLEQVRNNLFLLAGVIVFTVLALFSILFIRQRNLKKRAIEKAETVHRVAGLELQSLRSQLNPHFMFNSLNAIQELILLEENDKSHIYLSRFSKLLRILLDNADQAFVSLSNEVEFLRLYLDLETLRVPDLRYFISISPDIDRENTLLPNMILQPYLENAIWHGLSYKEKDKELQVRIYSDGANVNCEIEDNGVGRKKAEEFKSLFRKKHNSKGIELLNRRFKLLHEEYSSKITTATTDILKGNEVVGTLVTITIPVTISEQILARI